MIDVNDGTEALILEGFGVMTALTVPLEEFAILVRMRGIPNEASPDGESPPELIEHVYAMTPEAAGKLVAEIVEKVADSGSKEIALGFAVGLKDLNS